MSNAWGSPGRSAPPYVSGRPAGNWWQRASRPRKATVIGAGVVTALLAIGALAPSPEGDAVAPPPEGNAVAPPPEGNAVAPATTAVAAARAAPGPSPTVPAATATLLPTSVVPAVLVTNVVDGDTVVVSTGHRVRLIGIDTPEQGQCGFEAASNALAALVFARPVTLTPGARDDVDRYGRLLRYLDVGGVDTGLELIRQGLAIARYDSRDGYGWHPREATYVQADAAAPASHCAPVTPLPVPPPRAMVTSAAPAPQATGNCDPAYPTVCIPPPPPDLDCADILDRRFAVQPPDPHRFDRDRDGIGCES
jgi:endonuclease YncB( thermonuclease family)